MPLRPTTALTGGGGGTFFSLRGLTRPAKGGGPSFFLAALDDAVFAVVVSASHAVAHREASEKQITAVVKILMSVTQLECVYDATPNDVLYYLTLQSGITRHSTVDSEELRRVELLAQLNVDKEQQNGAVSRD